MLSSLNTEEFRKKCWQEDVDLFEEKPFKTEFLKIKFATLIKNRMLLNSLGYMYPTEVTDRLMRTTIPMKMVSITKSESCQKSSLG
jgi:hypothetical protein